MDRREFLEKSGCGMTCLMATPFVSDAGAQSQPARQPQYKIDIEIFEARQDSWCHKKGDKFEYQKDMAKICPWLLSSMHDMIILLQRGVTLPWKYEGTLYAKVMDQDGITTEYVRCPDPTSNLVAKIIRTKVA